MVCRLVTFVGSFWPVHGLFGWLVHFKLVLAKSRQITGAVRALCANTLPGQSQLTCTGCFFISEFLLADSLGHFVPRSALIFRMPL